MLEESCLQGEDSWHYWESPSGEAVENGWENEEETLEALNRQEELGYDSYSGQSRRRIRGPRVRKRSAALIVNLKGRLLVSICLCSARPKASPSALQLHWHLCVAWSKWYNYQLIPNLCTQHGISGHKMHFTITGFLVTSPTCTSHLDFCQGSKNALINQLTPLPPGGYISCAALTLIT